MKDYLAIIRKLDFVDLFKYGQFGINYAVEFDGNISVHADDDELFNRLTYRMNMYEYSFEYMIIHFRSAEEDEFQYKRIDIRNVQGVYTFDTEAKTEMSISFDPRIQLLVSPWADRFAKLQQKLYIKQSARGVDNLWTIFDLTEEDRRKCEEIITSDIVQEVFRELYAYERPVGEQSIWTYLLRYERHSYYPKGMLGYFCDFIHVFCNYNKKKELSGEVAETTNLYPQLKACKNPQIAPLYKIVEASPLFKLTEEASGCRFAMAAPLFLYLKAEFADGMEHKPDEKIVSYAKEIGGFECSIAVYLLGLALGYDKTYDAFYDVADLSFFKKKNEVNPQNEQQNSDKVIIDKQGETIPFNEEKLPLVWVRKGDGKKVDVKPAYTEEEFDKLLNNGYKQVDKFTKKVKDIIIALGFDPEMEKSRLASKRNSSSNS